MSILITAVAPDPASAAHQAAGAAADHLQLELNIGANILSPSFIIEKSGRFFFKLSFILLLIQKISFAKRSIFCQTCIHFSTARIVI